MRRDLIVTWAVQLAAFIGNAVLLGLVARRFGESGAGLFSIARRISTSAQPVLLMGSTILVARDLGRIRFAERKALIVVSGAFPLFAVAIALIGISIPGWIGTLLFGAAGSIGDGLVQGTVLFVASLAIQGWLYAYFRSSLDFVRAGASQLLILVAVPLITMMLVGTSLDAYVFITGIAMMSIAGAIYVRVMLTEVVESKSRLTWPLILAIARRIAKFGVPRIPMFFMLGVLMAGGAIVLLRTGLVAEASRYNLTLSAVRMLVSGVAPVGLVLLPHLARSRELSARRMVECMLSFLADTIVPMAIALEVFLPGIMRAWLGVDELYLQTVHMGILAGSAVFLVTYELLRNVLDAAADFPYNTLHGIAAVSIGVVTLVVLLLAHVRIDVAVSIATSASFAVLGALTYIRAAFLFRLRLNGLIGRIAMNALASAVVLRMTLSPVAVLIASTCLGLLLALRSPWIRALQHVRIR